jgi:hypothetical protein
MIRQQFNIEGYWDVVVFWDVDYNYPSIIVEELSKLKISIDELEAIFDKMESKKAKAVTYSNLKLHKSVVLFNEHNSLADYLSSVVHEAEHIKQAMLKVYKVEDKGEPPAYTIGYIVKKMFDVFKKML